MFDQIEGLKNRAFKLVQRAANEKDGWRAAQLSALIQLLDIDLEELRTLALRVMDTESQLNLMEQHLPSVPRISVQVTEGMIRQKTLSLTVGIRKKVLKQGQDILIDFGGKVGLVRSQILTGNNTLKVRGPVRRFYEEQGIKAGDWLDVIETRPGAWRIWKAPFSTRTNTLIN